MSSVLVLGHELSCLPAVAAQCDGASAASKHCHRHARDCQALRWGHSRDRCARTTYPLLSKSSILGSPSHTGDGDQPIPISLFFLHLHVLSGTWSNGPGPSLPFKHASLFPPCLGVVPHVILTCHSREIARFAVLQTVDLACARARVLMPPCRYTGA